MSDDLLEALKRHQDHETFQAIFVRYFTPLVSHSAEIVGSRQEAEDIVSKLFIKLWEQKLYMDIKKSLWGYLLTSCKNHSLMYLRQAKSAQKRHSRYFENKDREEDSWQNFVRDEADSETQAALQAMLQEAIDQLPPKRKRSLILHYILGMDYISIAEVSGVGKHGAKKNVISAVSDLKKFISRKA